MLSIQPSTTSQKCTPNLLPARIDHNGPINNTTQYFQPSKDEQGTSHVYFRGRHLHGTSLPLPANYTGAVLHVTDKTAPSTQSQATANDDDEQEEQANVDVKIAEQIGTFDEIVVWQHGGEVDGERDMFVRGVKEWVGWAESMHVEEEGEEKKGSGA